MKRGVITNSYYILCDGKYEKFSKKRLVAELIYWICMGYAGKNALRTRWLGSYWYTESYSGCDLLVEKMLDWGKEKFGFSYSDSVLNSSPPTLVVNDKVLVTPKSAMEFTNFIADMPLETKEDRNRKYKEAWKRFCEDVAEKFCEMIKTRRENV